MSGSILQQQIDYYRARAGEYDEWFYRLNRYDQGEALNQQWFDEGEEVAQALRKLGRFERVLELAAGTGIWTIQLAEIADHVTAIDASDEVIALNQQKPKATNVVFEKHDLFLWEPTEQYDLVFFSFWLSHVPESLAPEFMAKVARASKPGGSVFIIDSMAASTSTAKNQSIATTDAQQVRRLNDGSTYQIIKIYYQPDQLQKLLMDAGFEAAISTTEHYFIYAHGTKKPNGD